MRVINNTMESNMSENNSESFEEDSDQCKKEPDMIKSSILLRHISHATPSLSQGSSSKVTLTIGKHKRRTKVNTEVRTFKCQYCEKTYLSYPALYTHMKAKHASPHESLPSGSGRSRGRPKKVWGFIYIGTHAKG